MGLDYSSGCVNFRDFGAYVNLILDKKYLPEGKLFRGGSIDFVRDPAEIAYARSIINLRNGSDYHYFNIDYYHFPMSNKIEKYDTANKEVKTWLNSIIKIFEDDNFKYPVLVHCLSGKDRTGIVVSAILLVLGVDIGTVEEEYLLSEGEIRLSLIRQSIEGMKDITTYFNRVDLEKVRTNIMKGQNS